MKILCVANRFANRRWPGIEWISPPPSEPKDIGVGVCAEGDFLVYLGPDAELLHNPDILVEFRQNELLGVIGDGESIHTTVPDFPAPLGYPRFHPQFFVLKLADERAAKFLAAWQASGRDLTRAAYECGIKPIIYPAAVVKFHCPLDSQPRIAWGFA